MDREAWTETWAENATAFDRVRGVAMSVDEPRPATWVADRSVVAESTARAHLERLVDLGALRTGSSGGATTYEPDPAYVRFREVRRLVDDHDPDELTAFAAEVKDEIAALRETHDADSPAELRRRATSAETSADEARDLRRAASDWTHYRYRLSLLDDAVARYDEYHTGSPAPA